MRYIDYLRINIKVSAWIISAAIVGYAIIRFFGLIEPIRISIGTVIANFVIPMLLASFLQWQNACKK